MPARVPVFYGQIVMNRELGPHHHLLTTSSARPSKPLSSNGSYLIQQESTKNAGAQFAVTLTGEVRAGF